MRMSKQEKKGMVPALRFPEFRDAGEWKISRLQELLEAVIDNRGKTPPLSANGYPLVEVNALGSNFVNYNKVSKFVDEDTYCNWFRGHVKPGDILFSTVGAIAECSLVFHENKPVIAQNIVGLRFKKYISQLFALYLLTVEQNKDKFLKITMGAVQPSLKVSQMVHLGFLLPKLEEQQKIADCLTSIDELIAAQTQKLAALKTHKKGLMQQLFPAEGETTPKLRFPEFQDKGEEWEVRKLSQVCEINPSSNALPELFVYIDLESVEAGKLLKKNRISREGAPSRAQRLLKCGDVIFQMVRPYQKNNYYFLPDDDVDYVASTGYAQLRANESSRYLFQYLRNDRFVDRVLSKCTGSNYPAINSSSLSEILVEVPQENEQERIADCLTSIDELITAQTEKIESLKAYEKGLMQQLFPVMDEVGE